MAILDKTLEIVNKFVPDKNAQAELEKNGSFYAYWAKSASASIVNAYGAGLTKKIYV